MPKQQRMNPRGQRRPLPAGCDVAWTEIGHRGNPGAFGNHGRFSDLQCGTYGADPRIFDAMRQMMHRLAVRSDQVNIFWGHIEPTE